jgi:iron complex transport system substrate-binding protein
MKKIFIATLALTAVTVSSLTISPTPSQAQSSNKYPVTIENCGQKLTFTKAPERVVTLYPPVTEMALALGLEKRIVGAASTAEGGPVLPEYRAAYARVPSLSKTSQPSKEVMLAAKPELVLDNLPGYHFSAQEGFITEAELKAAKTQIYVLTAKCGEGKPNAKIEDVYTDLRNLGRIFGVEVRAEAIIKGMQLKIAGIRARIAGKTPIKALIYNDGEGPVTVFGPGPWDTVLRLTGGINAFANEKDSFLELSVERVAGADIDVFVIPDYSDGKATVSAAYLLKTFPNTKAGKNKRTVIIPYEQVNTSIQQAFGVETLARAFYPDAFKK